MRRKPDLKDHTIKQEIYDLTINKELTQQQIADRYETSRRTVGRIVIELDAQDYVAPLTKEQSNAEFLKRHINQEKEATNT